MESSEDGVVENIKKIEGHQVQKLSLEEKMLYLLGLSLLLNEDNRSYFQDVAAVLDVDLSIQEDFIPLSQSMDADAVSDINRFLDGGYRNVFTVDLAVMVHDKNSSIDQGILILDRVKNIFTGSASFIGKAIEVVDKLKSGDWKNAAIIVAMGDYDEGFRHIFESYCPVHYDRVLRSVRPFDPGFYVRVIREKTDKFINEEIGLVDFKYATIYPQDSSNESNLESKKVTKRAIGIIDEFIEQCVGCDVAKYFIEYMLDINEYYLYYSSWDVVPENRNNFKLEIKRLSGKYMIISNDIVMMFWGKADYCYTSDVLLKYGNGSSYINYNFDNKELLLNKIHSVAEFSTSWVGDLASKIFGSNMDFDRACNVRLFIEKVAGYSFFEPSNNNGPANTEHQDFLKFTGCSKNGFSGLYLRGQCRGEFIEIDRISKIAESDQKCAYLILDDSHRRHFCLEI